MANPVLGAAFIDVHANTAPFARELGPEIEAIVKGVQPAAQKSGEKVGKKLGQGVKKGAKKELDGLWAEIGRVFDRNSRRDQGIVIAAGRSIGESFGVVIRRSATRVLGKGFVRDISKIWDRDARAGRNLFKHAGSSIGSAILSSVKSGVSGIGGILGAVGSSIGNVSSKGPLGIIVGGGIILLIDAVIGAVGSLIYVMGALVNVVGLLPGVVFGAVAAFAPLIVAFQGFGEAIGAIMEGDPEKINEALKNLSPSARGVAREFQKLMPFFHELRLFTQEKFFSNLGGSLTKVFGAIGPILKSGFGGVASAGGAVFKQLGDMLSNPASQAFLKDIFAFAARTVNTLGPSLVRFLGALMRVADGSIPALDDLIARFSGVLDRFSGFLTGLTDEEYQSFFDEFNAALDKLILLSKSAWNLVDSIVTGTGKDGQAYKLFDSIVDAIDSLTAYFSSKEGQKGLEGMVTLAGTFVLALMGAVVVLGEIAAIFQRIIDMITWIIEHNPWAADNDLAQLATGSGRTGSGSVSHGGMRGHADGVISTTEHAAMISEGNKAEAVIPLTDPARARQLADESGLTQMLGGGGDTVVVFIGDEQIQGRVERWSGKVLKQFSKNMRFGPRVVGQGAN